MPVDPGRDWLAAGITGLQRQREWDAVVTADGAGAPGDEVEFVALADGTLILESDGAIDVAHFAAALAESIEAPYRALAVKRPEVWAVGAVAIEVERLDPDPADQSSSSRGTAPSSSSRSTTSRSTRARPLRSSVSRPRA